MCVCVCVTQCLLTPPLYVNNSTNQPSDTDLFVDPALYSNPDWQEFTGAYGNKHYFGDFQALGCQAGSEILCAVSLYNGETAAERTKARQLLSPFYTLFERFCHTHAIRSCQPGKA